MSANWKNLDLIIFSCIFSDEREDVQKKTFTKWINSQLSKVKCDAKYFDDPQTDLNPLYTGGLFHCYMLDEAIGLVYFVTFILFLMENPVSKQCRP